MITSWSLLALGSFWSAILVSVVFVVALVEVILQVVCSRHGLSLGAKSTLFVRLLLFVFFSVAYPVSNVLDLVLGKGSSAIFRRAELKTLVDLHGLKAYAVDRRGFRAKRG